MPPSVVNCPPDKLAATVRGAGDALWRCRDEEILLEGPANSSKSISACIKLVLSCIQYPGSRHLLARKTRKSMTDTILVTMDSVVEQICGSAYGEVSRVERDHRHSYRIYGSEIVLAGLDEPKKAYGSAWGLVVVEEAIEIGREAWELFFRSAREGKLQSEETLDTFPYHQYIAVTNPGPKMHWLNKRAFPAPEQFRGRIKSLAHYQALQRFNSGPQGSGMRRLLAKHEDNPRLFDQLRWCYNDRGRKEIGFLERMSGHARKWMLDGIWCSPEGTVFAGAFTDDNVITPFRIPDDWPIWVLVDPGENHPCAVGWFTRSLTGKAILIAEIHGSKLGGVAPVARMIQEKNEQMGWNPIGYFLDPRHGFASTFQSTATIAEQFETAGLPNFQPWPAFQGMGLFASVERVRTELQTGNLLFFEGCDGFIGDFESWEYKKNADGTPARGDDAFVDANNDGIDCTRGFVCMNLGRPPVETRAQDELEREAMQKLEAEAEAQEKSLGNLDEPAEPLEPYD